MTKLPQPDHFPLKTLSARWIARYGPEFTEEHIHGLAAAGHLNIESETERVYPEGADFMQRDVHDMLQSYKVRYHYYITRVERDRFESKYPARIPVEADNNEPSSKGRNSYLGLIGVLAEWLADEGKLDIKRPYAGANQVELKAAEYGANIGKAGTIAEKLKAARTLIGKGNR